MEAEAEAAITWVEAEADDYKTVEAEAEAVDFKNLEAESEAKTVGFWLVEAEAEAVDFSKGKVGAEAEAPTNSPPPDTLVIRAVQIGLLNLDENEKFKIPKANLWAIKQRRVHLSYVSVAFLVFHE